MSTIKGTGQAVRQPDRKRFERGLGWTTIVVHEGPTLASVEGLIPQLLADGHTTIDILSPDNTKWRIEASVPRQSDGGSSSEPAENIWELSGYPETKDIRLHPYFANVSDSDRRAIETALTDRTSGPAITDPAAIDLYSYLLRGQTSFFEEQVVLRHTATGATYDDVPPGLSDDLTIFTFAQLPRSEITSAVNSALNDLVSPTVPDGYVWGWLKMPTTIRQNVFSKAQLVEEWRLDLWPNVLYG